MRRFIWFGFLLCVSWPVLSSEHIDKLRHIDNVRLSDHQTAKAELANIPVTSLESDELHYYRYLEGLVLTLVDGNELTDIIARYDSLLEEPVQPELRIRVLGSLINLLGVKRDWKWPTAG